jgi:hypothetical protein
MGLMQLMPGTWVELSVRYGLGLDPFDPRDNVFAGTAYLREMHDGFGSVGFLAAYHAGPSRYEHHLSTGQALAPDTVAYVAAVAPLLDDEHGERAAFGGRRAVPWRQSSAVYRPRRRTRLTIGVHPSCSNVAIHCSVHARFSTPKRFPAELSLLPLNKDQPQ